MDKKSSIPFSPPSTHTQTLQLNHIINSDPILSEYFRNNCTPDQYWVVAHQLMLNGLRYRVSNQNDQRKCFCQCHSVRVRGWSNQKQKQKLKQKQKQKQLRRNVQQQLKTSTKVNKQVYIPVQQTKAQQKNKSNSKNKHYNVAYVKHNRFLSPSQKKQLVTPKVTQIMHLKSEPLVIYGKPRVKIDNQCGCPYHDNQQECFKSIPYGGPCQPKSPQQKTVREIHVRQQSPYNNGKKQFNLQNCNNQLSKYKSTPNLLKNSKQSNMVLDPNKTKKNKKSKRPQNVNNEQNKNINYQQVPGQTIYVDRIVQIQSRVPGKMRYLNSPQNIKYKNRVSYDYSEQFSQDNSSYLHSKYQDKSDKKRKKKEQENNNNKEIQSKIKFLIDRDKKNKAMQNYMKKQQQRIKQLQIMMKNNSERNNNPNKKTLKITSKQALLYSSDSDMTLIDSKIVNDYLTGFNQNTSQNVNASQKLKKNMRNQKQNVNNQRQENKGSAAYFGTRIQSQSQEIFQEDCEECSKTFDQGLNQSSMSQSISVDESFSQFKT